MALVQDGAENELNLGKVIRTSCMKLWVKTHSTVKIKLNKNQPKSVKRKQKPCLTVKKKNTL